MSPYPLNSFSSTTTVVAMRSTTLIGIFAIALASAKDVGVTIAVDDNLSLRSSFKRASGTCRMSGRVLPPDEDAKLLCLFSQDGIGPALDNRISSIATDWGVVCNLFS